MYQDPKNPTQSPENPNTGAGTADIQQMLGVDRSALAQSLTQTAEVAAEQKVRAQTEDHVHVGDIAITLPPVDADDLAAAQAAAVEYQEVMQTLDDADLKRDDAEAAEIMQAANENLCHNFLMLVKQFLEKAPGPVSNATASAIGPSIVWNGFASTLPDDISTGTRLDATAGIQGFLLLSMAAATAAIFKQDYQANPTRKVQELLQQSRHFANAFNFIYQTASRVLGLIFQKHDIQNKIAVGFGLGGLLAVSFANACYMSYHANQPPNSGFYKVMQALNAAFTFGALAFSMDRIVNNIDSPDQRQWNEELDSGLIFQGVMLVVALLALVSGKQQHTNNLANRIAILNNILTQVGLFLEAGQNDDTFLQAMTASVVGVSTVGYGIELRCPDLLQHFARPTAAHAVPLLSMHAQDSNGSGYGSRDSTPPALAADESTPAPGLNNTGL